MLLLRDVQKWFGGLHAVRGVSMEVTGGQVVGLLGPNGAGKTTTIRMVTGIFPPDAGSIAVAGHDTVDASALARRAIGYLPESAPAYGEMSVESAIDFRARLFGMPRAARRTRVETVIERCWLSDVRRRRVGHLSKGYRQRVGLAAALVHDPKVLVLDEPSNGLDPTQIAEMRRLIRELGRDRVVLVSSHILPEVEKTCDRVVVIIRGRIRADGTPASLVGSSAGFIVEAATPTPPRPASEDAFAVILRSAVGSAAGIHLTTDASVIRARVTGASEGAMAAVGEALGAAGWSVRELARTTRSLESVFVDLLDDARAEVA